MSRIARDPRVIITKVFQSHQLSMNQGWALSMCYSFEITSSQMEIIQDDDLDIDDVFSMMKNTHQAIQEKLFLPDFYKEIMQTILLKYIAVKSKMMTKKVSQENMITEGESGTRLISY